MASLSHDHDPIACHKANNERQKVIQDLKDLVSCLNDCDRTGNEYGGRAEAPEWTRPLIVYPLTKPRKAIFDTIEKTPPWEKKRKSIQIMGGAVVQGCSCLRRNGLQADCQMSECKGHPLCLTKPYPMCPPSGRADVLVTPSEAETMLRQLGPPPNADGPGKCQPGTGCLPDCVPCSSTVKDICRWLPEWMDEKQGGKTGGAKGGKALNGGDKKGPTAGTSGGQLWCCVARGI